MAETKHDLSHLDGAQRIAEERHRQVALGFGRAHDADEHSKGELVWAARAYAAVYSLPKILTSSQTAADEVGWPFDHASWKPSDDPIRNLEKAGALIAAEIDRLARLAGSEAP